jgi:hypothetical protein
MANKQKNEEQSKRFIEAAKKAEADETEEGAARAFKSVTESKKKTTTRPRAAR